MRGAARYLSVLLSLFCLSGCGTYVPDIQEFWGAPDEAGNRVNAIAYQVGCELGKAVHGAFQTDERTGKPRRIAELQNWTAELVLFLIVDEKSNFSPSVTYIDPLKSMQSFSLSLAGNLSAEATRTDKLHLFYPLKQFVNYDNDKPCIPERQSGGILFTQSDLKLYEWMSREVVPQFTGTAANYKDIAPKSLAAAFSTDIKFEIVSSGGITPTWKLTRVSTAASSGSLFGASRDRTQELIITLGPTEPLGKGGNTFGTVAQQSSFSSEFSSEVAAKNIANRLDR